jgi:hypothetical protein
MQQKKKKINSINSNKKVLKKQSKLINQKLNYETKW